MAVRHQNQSLNQSLSCAHEELMPKEITHSQRERWTVNEVNKNVYYVALYNVYGPLV